MSGTRIPPYQVAAGIKGASDAFLSLCIAKDTVGKMRGDVGKDGRGVWRKGTVNMRDFAVFVVPSRKGVEDEVGGRKMMLFYIGDTETRVHVAEWFTAAAHEVAGKEVCAKLFDVEVLSKKEDLQKGEGIIALSCVGETVYWWRVGSEDEPMPM